jgi:hypothetical protein
LSGGAATTQRSNLDLRAVFQRHTKNAPPERGSLWMRPGRLKRRSGPAIQNLGPRSIRLLKLSGQGGAPCPSSALMFSPGLQASTGLDPSAIELRVFAGRFSDGGGAFTNLLLKAKAPLGETGLSLGTSALGGSAHGDNDGYCIWFPEAHRPPGRRERTVVTSPGTAHADRPVCPIAIPQQSSKKNPAEAGHLVPATSCPPPRSPSTLPAGGLT